MNSRKPWMRFGGAAGLVASGLIAGGVLAAPSPRTRPRIPRLWFVALSAAYRLRSGPGPGHRQPARRERSGRSLRGARAEKAEWSG